MSSVAETTAAPTRIRRWEGLPYWLILPAVAYLILFFGWPMVEAFDLAFREEGHWTLGAFRTMVDDFRFEEALRTTLILIGVIIPLQFALALGMALLVSAHLRFRSIFLYIFLLPLAISDLAGIVWSAIFTERGYLNTILQHLGIGNPDILHIWLDPSNQAVLIGTIVVAEIWRSTALIMIILVAGLQGIPRSSTRRRRCSSELVATAPAVTLPMLKPSIQVALLLRIVLAFEVFSTVIAIAGDGTTVLAAEAYRWENTNQDENVAAVRDADPRPHRRVRDLHPAASPHEGAAAAMRAVGVGVLKYGFAILVSLWVLLPIYFITLAAFSTEEAVYAYPKQLVPRDMSTDTMQFFLDSEGIVPSLWRSIEVALLTLVIALGVGIPAGYAVARFAFRGSDAFRLGVVATRLLRS